MKKIALKFANQKMHTKFEADRIFFHNINRL